jgi:hypothetical protein
MLRDAGFERPGTASAEIRGADLGHIVQTLQRVLAELDDLPDGCDLDHLWVYVDQSA